MKNIETALDNVVLRYTENTLTYKINSIEDYWVVDVHNQNAPGSLLKIEVIDDEGIPKCCVLEKVNVGRKSMYKFMNRLLNELE